ncbi:M23 family metallopeptidase [Motilimonas pumila]|uniref:M23 family metallopeptidase n=1 Tax=Motilimonas pumila TaxID=2303987 RepID=A0A418YL02_9GAMM|nr:peptidoglycan DD-metalloendopeptidase family protein [Motilimonas pumila]RJG51490.1 M23 family metallopeptidase [Motilimonas pumila]
MKASVLVILLSLCFSQAWAARDIYKYQDENGNWVFSGTEPTAQENVMVDTVAEEKVEPVRIIHQADHQKAQIYGVNNYHIPVTVSIDFPKQKNVRFSEPVPAFLPLPPNSREPLFTISAKNVGPWQFQIKYQYTPGELDPNYDKDFPYIVPFGGEKAYRISQSFNGTFSHQDSYSQYAIDIPMPEGTPILAARGGVVVEVVENNQGAAIADFAQTKANIVRIAHDDGSMAVYAHLQKLSAKVRVGQKVSQGQHIASSGNTGFSTGPHLHFAVQVNESNVLTSVPFVLRTEKGVVSPESGLTLRSGV